MRTRYGIHFVMVALALGVGHVAHGQNPIKAPDTAKTKAQPAAQPGKDVAQPRPADPATKATSGDASATAKKEIDPDEQAIRESAEAFTKLYNAHDAKGLAQLFALKAEMIDEDDQVVKGRHAIQTEFERVFKQNPDSSMQVNVESVRVLTPNLAIEEGTARSKDSPTDEESFSTYVAIHVKAEGKWHLACVRDWDAPPAELTPHERLEQSLSWMIGEWVDERPDSRIHTVCKWDESGNYLLQDFQVNRGGAITMSGSVRIGWNAVTKQFQSWVFDSQGGHATGSWFHDDERWLINVVNATAKGDAGSATNYYRPIDRDTIAWGSFHRVLNGESLDDIPELVLKRRPPQPGE